MYYSYIIYSYEEIILIALVSVGMTVILRRGFAREIMKNSHETSLLVQQ